MYVRLPGYTRPAVNQRSPSTSIRWAGPEDTGVGRLVKPRVSLVPNLMARHSAVDGFKDGQKTILPLTRPLVPRLILSWVNEW